MIDAEEQSREAASSRGNGCRNDKMLEFCLYDVHGTFVFVL